MASATPDLRLPSKPQRITAHWPVPNYTARWQRHMCVNNLPRVALDSGAAGIRTRDLLIASPAPYHCATEPHSDGNKCGTARGVKEMRKLRCVLLWCCHCCVSSDKGMPLQPFKSHYHDSVKLEWKCTVQWCKLRCRTTSSARIIIQQLRVQELPVIHKKLASLKHCIRTTWVNITQLKQVS